MFTYCNWLTDVLKFFLLSFVSYLHLFWFWSFLLIFLWALNVANHLNDTFSIPHLYDSTHLLISGDLMKPRAWMLSTEERVVMGPHSNIVSGLAALFASFYNLNLQYPEDSSCTLEFIQRYSIVISKLAFYWILSWHPWHTHTHTHIFVFLNAENKHVLVQSGCIHFLCKIS